MDFVVDLLHRAVMEDHSPRDEFDYDTTRSPCCFRACTVRPLLLENVFQVKDFSLYTAGGRVSLFIISLFTRHVHHKM